MRQFLKFAFIPAFASIAFCGDTIEKCSPQTHRSAPNSVYICELLSKPKHYANRPVTVRGWYLGGQIDTPSILFGDECRSKSVELLDPEDLKGLSMVETRQYDDSPDERQNRRKFYSLGEQMCPGYYVGDSVAVEGTFTGVLMSKKVFRAGKNGTANGSRFRGREVTVFVLHSVADTCRVNDCPSP